MGVDKEMGPNSFWRGLLTAGSLFFQQLFH